MTKEIDSFDDMMKKRMPKGANRLKGELVFNKKSLEDPRLSPLSKILRKVFYDNRITRDIFIQLHLGYCIRNNKEKKTIDYDKHNTLKGIQDVNITYKLFGFIITEILTYQILNIDISIKINEDTIIKYDQTNSFKDDLVTKQLVP